MSSNCETYETCLRDLIARSRFGAVCIPCWLADDIAKWIETHRGKAEHSGWIPCSERLPDEYGWYLITTSDGSVDIATFDDGKNVYAAWSGCDAEGFYLFTLRGIDIIAWMPLPPAYKEDGES